MKLGHQQLGADRFGLVPDKLYLFSFRGAPEPEFEDVEGALPDALAQDVTIGSLIVYLDGLATDEPHLQLIRPVVLAILSPLVTHSHHQASFAVIGDEVEVEAGDPGGWRHLIFPEPPTVPQGWLLLAGFSVGGFQPVARLAGTLADSEIMMSTSTFPYGTPLDADGGGDEDPDVGFYTPTMLAFGVESWTAPENLPDEDRAALPLPAAERSLATPSTSQRVAGVCGWHYDPDDPPAPATAIARTGGPFAALVGERLRLTTRAGTTVVVLVDDEQDFDAELADEDLSVARPAFVRLAPLWTDTLPVVAEVLS